MAWSTASCSHNVPLTVPSMSLTRSIQTWSSARMLCRMSLSTVLRAMRAVSRWKAMSASMNAVTSPPASRMCWRCSSSLATSASVARSAASRADTPSMWVRTSTRSRVRRWPSIRPQLIARGRNSEVPSRT